MSKKFVNHKNYTKRPYAFKKNKKMGMNAHYRKPVI